MKIYLLCLMLSLSLVTGRTAFGEDQFSIVSNYSQDVAAKKQLSLRVEKMLLDEQYQELEDLADSFRKNRETYLDGDWKLAVLYDALSFYQDKHTEEDWSKRIGQLKEWNKKRPESITAKVALSECMTGYAFHGRGYKYASETEEMKFNIFNERLNEASKIISDALRLKTTCPGTWSAIMRFGMTGLERQDYENVFAKAISLEPKYSTYYFRKTWSLLPRWYGDKGELAKFADTAANSIGGDDGDVLYSQIIWFIKRFDHPKLFPEDVVGVSWERVTRGLNLINEKSSTKVQK